MKTFIVCALCLAPSAAGAQSWTAAIDSMMQAQLASFGTPGAQIAIVQGGRITYAKAYGVADVESGRPVTTTTLFQVGSVTKTFTAALLAQLEASHVVDLQAPISHYVPELAGRRVGTVTTRQLLTHTAGWGSRGNAFGPNDEAALDRVFRVLGDTIVMTDAGHVFSYSNAGFSMAGYVAERVAGRPFFELLDSVLLRPLGTTRVTARPTVAMTYDFSLGHVVDANRSLIVQRPMPNNTEDWPAGFMYASATDVARLAIALMNDGMVDGKRVLAADAVRAMTTGRFPIPETPSDSAAYGLRAGVVDGRRAWSKDGVVDGFLAQMRIWPDERLAVVVTGNRQTNLARRTTELAAQIVAGIKVSAAPVYTADRPPTPAERAALSGTYTSLRATVLLVESSDGLDMEVAGKRLSVKLSNDGSHLVIPRPPQPNLIFYIGRDRSGRVDYLFAASRALVRVER